MITLDTLRSAALSDQPWIELDRLVRAELGAGRLTRAIYDEILSLQQEVRKSPGFTEVAEDAIGDTLDALIGFCNAKYAYKNPPILPSEDEIAKLPRWARVAFAARCARRILPLPKHRRPDTPEHTVLVATRAVEYVEYSASVAGAEKDPTIGPAFFATEGKGFGPVTDSLAALGSVEAEDDARTPGYVAVAARASSGDAYPLAKIEPHIRRDFDHLARFAEAYEWKDETPVPPEVFGPLWPEGPPKGWPPVTDAPARTELAIEAFARDRATEQMIEDDVVNLFNALNRYHIARSGVRLTLEQFRSLLPSLVPAEA